MFPFMFMFMLPWTFALAFAFELPALVVPAALLEFAAVAAGVAAGVAALLTELAFPFTFELSAEEQPTARKLTASAAVSTYVLIPSLLYPTGVNCIRAS